MQYLLDSPGVRVSNMSHSLFILPAGHAPSVFTKIYKNQCLKEVVSMIANLRFRRGSPQERSVLQRNMPFLQNTAFSCNSLTTSSNWDLPSCKGAQVPRLRIVESGGNTESLAALRYSLQVAEEDCDSLSEVQLIQCQVDSQWSQGHCWPHWDELPLLSQRTCNHAQ